MNLQGKVCNKCKEHKSLSEFYKDKKNKDGFRYECKLCAKKRSDNVCRFKRWFTNKKGQSKWNGVKFTIEPTDIPGVKIREIKTYFKTVPSWEVTEYPKVCSKWGIELDWGMNGVIQYNSPSLDRIDPTKSYIPGNVRLVCQSYNGAKLNCTLDEWDIIEKNMARYVLFGE